MQKYIISKLHQYFDSYYDIPTSCWSAIILTLLQSTAIGIIYFVSLYFISNLHFSIALTGVLLSFYGAGTIFGGIIAGKLSDYLSPKHISTVGLTIQAITLSLLTQLTNRYFIMSDLFILGLSFYSFKTSNDVWMLQNCKSSSTLRMKTINISRVAMNLGLGISGILIGMFAEHRFNAIFYALSLLLILSSVYLTLQKSNEERDVEIHSNQQDFLSANTPKYENMLILVISLFSLFCVGLMIAQLGTTYPIYVKDAFPALGMKAVSILYLLDTFLIVITQAQLTQILSNQNKVMTMGIGAFLMGTGMLILSVSSSFSIAIISCLAWTTGEMIFMPVSQLLCYENGGAKKKGQTMGLYQTVYASSSVIGPIAGGYIYTHTNGNNVWYLCFIFGAICLSFCLLALKAKTLGFRSYANTAT